MSKRPEDVGYKELIRIAFNETGDRVPEGWFFYREARGHAGLDAFRSWVSGKTEPRASEYAVLSRSINGRLVAKGKEAMLPELPSLIGPDGDDGLSSDQDSAAYKAWCNQTPADLDEEVAA